MRFKIRFQIFEQRTSILLVMLETIEKILCRINPVNAAFKAGGRRQFPVYQVVIRNPGEIYTAFEGVKHRKVRTAVNLHEFINPIPFIFFEFGAGVAIKS